MTTIFGSLGHDTQMAGLLTLPDPSPTITANTLPLVVPMLPVPGVSASGNTGGVVTSPSSTSTTPATAVGSSTQFSVGAYLLDVVEHPFTHWIAAIVLLLVVLWIYRHFLKGLLKFR